MKEYVYAQIEELAGQLKELKLMSEQVVRIADICIEAIKNGHKVIWCGNGGSAAQAQHLAAELVGRYKINRPAMNSLSLTVDTSNLTAIGNDYGYDVVFSRQLEGVGQKGDVLVGLSTSGNSKNVVLAFEQAKKTGITTIALVGAKGGLMKELADYSLCVPATTSAHIQEMHITVGHLVCDLIEREFYGNLNK
ncbi:MAG: D-sedoheptulose 7-phosphate isomerase [Alphaproteobacteria bacterium]|nr:D-sedoheptulose 7-phosphate isomerase [Alphaproteobacteria bacterium]